jgi:hypothetical protein
MTESKKILIRNGFGVGIGMFLTSLILILTNILRTAELYGLMTIGAFITLFFCYYKMIENKYTKESN